MRDPHTDLEINSRSQLEACRRHNPGAKVVYAGTRQVYGKVDETHLVRTVAFYRNHLPRYVEEAR
jgi:UDP-glucose 4-epimerase